MTRNLTGLLLAIAVGSTAMGQHMDPRSLVAEANRAFVNGQYATALAGYDAAALSLPESPEIAYNQGVVHYRLGDYTRARKAFNRALSNESTELEARIKFNLGNVAYAEALKNRADPHKAIRLLKTAIGHYRDAFKLDPDEDDAQSNAELALRLIKNLLDNAKPPQEGEQQQEGQDGNTDDKPGQSGGEPQADQQPPEDDQQQGSQEETTAQMTQSEAKELLQIVRDKERQRHEQRDRRRQTERTPVPKDW